MSNSPFKVIRIGEVGDTYMPKVRGWLGLWYDLCDHRWAAPDGARIAIEQYRAANHPRAELAFAVLARLVSRLCSKREVSWYQPKSRIERFLDWMLSVHTNGVWCFLFFGTLYGSMLYGLCLFCDHFYREGGHYFWR